MYHRRELLGRIGLAVTLLGARRARADDRSGGDARRPVGHHARAGGARRRGGVPAGRAAPQPAEFSIIAESVPGIDRVLDAAPAGGEAGGGIDDLALPFSLLGMPERLIAPFVEIVLDFDEQTGSEPVAGLLDRALLSPR